MNKFSIEAISVGKYGALRVAVPEKLAKSMLFLGIGQTRRNLEWVAQSAPDDMIVIEALPYLKAQEAKEMEMVGEVCLKKVFEQFDITKLVVYAESQAAIVLVHVLAASDVLPQKVVLLSPMGLNYSSLGRTEAQRYSSLMHRSRKFWSHRNQRLATAPNRETAAVLLADMLKNWKMTRTALKFAANQNVIARARKLAEKIPVHIFTGDNDELFPYKEIKQEIGGSSKVIFHELVHTRHYNRATKRGMRQLYKINDSL